MNELVEVVKQISLREAGYDEYWLRDQIYENPACLGRGELDAIAKERVQSSGGRLDLLLKDPEDNTMYEVELMLGETDETHIIRTIEYWDNEKRRLPLRQHFAVLVAEHVNRRFFNVVHLLSHSIPIIAIQVSLLDNGGRKNLFFTTLLDTYEEVEDGTPLEAGSYNRDYWEKRAKWTLETADTLLSNTQDLLSEPTLNYLKHYVAISASGRNYFWLHKRNMNKSALGIRVRQPLQAEVAALLDSNGIPYAKQGKNFYITVDKEAVGKDKNVLREIASLIKKATNAE